MLDQPPPKQNTHAPSPKHTLTHTLLPPLLLSSQTGILVELPLAGFFLKTFGGAAPDLNDLPSLDPQLHRSLLFLKHYQARERGAGLPGTARGQGGAGVHAPGACHRSRGVGSFQRPDSGLRLPVQGDVSDLGLTFTITDQVPGAGAREARVQGTRHTSGAPAATLRPVALLPFHPPRPRLRPQVELVPGGRDIPVTAANRLSYIYRVADYRLNQQAGLGRRPGTARRGACGRAHWGRGGQVLTPAWRPPLGPGCRSVSRQLLFCAACTSSSHPIGWVWPWAGAGLRFPTPGRTARGPAPFTRACADARARAALSPLGLLIPSPARARAASPAPGHHVQPGGSADADQRAAC